jgi:predicted RNase H-like nuclease
MVIIAGVDGCAVGWIVVQQDTETGRSSWCLAPDFRSVLDVTRGADIVAVDIPIGLLDQPVPGSRACDSAARALLRGKRASSVFPPPVRAALDCRLYPEALQANRGSSAAGIGISKQCFAILPKIREVDRVMKPELQRTIREIHPELCFFAMNGDRAITESKKTADGKAVRLALLQAHGFGSFPAEAIQSGSKISRSIKADDILDACAACWTAGRILSGSAVCIPSSPACDSRGLRMEMWR